MLVAINIFCQDTIKYIFNDNVKRNNDIMMDRLKIKILLIDDNREITDAVTFYLDCLDIPCTVTNDGREGLRKIKECTDFDLILLDIAMPEFTGFDVILELKKDGLLSARNIVFFTASNVNEEELLSQGAKGVIRKPISVDDLQQAIEKFRQG
jgi:two-component system OmpR family response regulator